MSRPVEVLVALAAIAVIGWVVWQFVEASDHGSRETAAASERSDCLLAEADLERFLAGGGLPPGVAEDKLRLVVATCRARHALGEF